jgi:hypothetical protein
MERSLKHLFPDCNINIIEPVLSQSQIVTERNSANPWLVDSVVDRNESISINIGAQCIFTVNFSSFHSFRMETFATCFLPEFWPEWKIAHLADFGCPFAMSECIPWTSILCNPKHMLILYCLLYSGRKGRARSPNSPDLEPTSDLVGSFDGEWPPNSCHIFCLPQTFSFLKINASQKIIPHTSV